MKHLLKNKKGVTILEGLIALTLLAVVATGTFAVLLSASRKSTAPDIREEMAYAVDKAHNLLQGYIIHQGYGSTMSGVQMKRPSNIDNDSVKAGGTTSHDVFASDFKNGLCSLSGGNFQVTDSTPLANGTHEIPCLLPPICDRQDAKSGSAGNTSRKSYFFYQVSTESSPVSKIPAADRVKELSDTSFTGSTTADAGDQGMVKITFSIKCNGFTL